MLVGIPVVVVLALFTIFQGLNEGFVFALVGTFALAVPTVVVLVATAVTVNSLSASLLFVFCLLVGIADIVGIVFVPCGLGFLMVMVLVVGIAMMCLLFGSLSCIGFVVGLKKLVIDDFCSVVQPACGVVCAGWLLELL